MSTHPWREEPPVHALFRRVYHGAEGGVVAALAFILADMGYSSLQGQSAVTPIHGVATVFNISSTVTPTPNDLAVGLVTHTVLGAFFGMVFALLVPLVRHLEPVAHGELRMLFLGGALYGLALYLFNYQLLGHLFFTWFTGPYRPNFGISIFIHVLYGAVLAPFFLGLVDVRRTVAAA